MTGPAPTSPALDEDAALLREAVARGLPVQDLALLRQALTHRSAVPESPLASNERLEFLGDAVLGLVAVEHLCALYPDRREGELAKAKALIVRKSTLAAAARRLDLLALVALGVSEEAMGGRKRESIAADVFEAVVAVIYLESGYGAARDFILRSLAPEVTRLSAASDWRDAKTVLQELRQARRGSPPVYRLAGERGEPHDRTFTMHVLVDGEVIGAGVAKSKRAAEQLAARDALDRLETGG